MSEWKEPDSYDRVGLKLIVRDPRIRGGLARVSSKPPGYSYPGSAAVDYVFDMGEPWLSQIEQGRFDLAEYQRYYQFGFFECDLRIAVGSDAAHSWKRKVCIGRTRFSLGVR